MKTALLVALAAILAPSLFAQEKSRYDINYHICMNDGKYTPCSAREALGQKRDFQDVRFQLQNGVQAAPVKSLAHSSVLPSRGRIRIHYEDPNAPYKGEENMQNDGVEKTAARNINYLDASVQLPPNDGGVTTR